MSYESSLLESPIEYLKGVGPFRSEMLKKEFGIETFGDLLMNFPFRYVDRSVFHKIRNSKEGDTIQFIGQFVSMEESGFKGRKRLTAVFQDDTGKIDVIWFRSTDWVLQTIKLKVPYVIYGKVTRYQRHINLAHPDIEAYGEKTKSRSGMIPVYSSTDKLSSKGLDSRGIRKLIQALLAKFRISDINENLPPYLIEKLRFQGRYETLRNMHLPGDEAIRQKAWSRIKFEELFFSQLQLIAAKIQRKKRLKGHPFEQVGSLFHKFYDENLEFELTGAQKRVMKEIRGDLGSGIQMNRLLQGDVGSGKTVIAIMCMLIAADNGFQCCLLAPTEILAKQHFNSIEESLLNLGMHCAFLSGSIKGQKRKAILKGLGNGHIHIIIGTHAILEDPVIFQNLGLAIIDEQHRFGVAQRARLWAKGKTLPPHILVMTATPIPRTLAMTLYGDLEVSTIDELPPGRKPVKTISRKEAGRTQVNNFMRAEIAKGRQVYIIFPLIEESEKLDLENLQEGYERLLQWFRQPDYQISVVHGRMKSHEKEYEMQRFVQRKTHIMVATTVIEVGVNIPNASVMVIENSERFGLSQLHQLRGRVGRGADQSYCILMSGLKVSEDGLTRIKTMCSTNDGFEIAEADLRLRGPGDVTGTRQSGAVEFKTVNLSLDYKILQTARDIAQRILDNDPEPEKPVHRPIREYLARSAHLVREWHRIS
ncbi:MAG: ATP-dependent DNA helicase RecG [Bacteroidetes bacterium]|nr:MAG: ATP-dependent DNA helicase RecG [Bacteroidota bacterium]